MIDRALLYKMLDTLDECIFIADESGTFIYANKAHLAALEETPDTIIGNNALDMQRNKQTNISVFEIVRETASPVMIRQLYVNSSGDTFDTLIRQTPIIENGKLKYSIGVCKQCTKLYTDNDSLHRTATRYPSFIYADPRMREVVVQANRIANLDVNVLLTGETGVGKDVLAEYIHEQSRHRAERMVKINCAAIAENLFDSEMFGYEKGTFTGALSGGKIGLIESANGGSLFLDEINSLPLSAQGKLLYVIENKVIRRVGSSKDTTVHFRLITASNQCLEECVRRQEFRQDLFYRLNIITIRIPPLRERPGDILPLAEYYVQKYNRRYGRKVVLTANFRKELKKHTWPGNVRELKHLIERVVIDGEVPEKMDQYQAPSIDMSVGDGISEKTPLKYAPQPITGTLLTPLSEQLEECEKQILIYALHSGKSNREIAMELKIDPATLSRKITKYKLRFRN